MTLWSELADRHTSKLKRMIVNESLAPTLEARLRMAATEIEARQYARGWSGGNRQAFDAAAAAMEIAASQPVLSGDALGLLESCLEYIRLSVARDNAGEPLDPDIAAAFKIAIGAMRMLRTAESLCSLHQAVVTRQLAETGRESYR